jgi:hypothetical protein
LHFSTPSKMISGLFCITQIIYLVSYLFSMLRERAASKNEVTAS